MPAGVIDASQLTKLASELEVLLRAGSPLGPGLLEAAPRWRGPLRPAAEKLAIRLQSGVPVDEALRTASELPPVFRALAATGLSTNRAADVLEAYSRTTAQMLTLREKLLRGLMYPAIVVLMAYGLSILVAAASLGLWVAWPADATTAILLAAAGALQAWRLVRWAGYRAARDPLVLVLHVAYGCVPLGFLAVAAAIAWPAAVPMGAGMHLWTAGAIAGMTLAVMTRATLGHTGRALVATPATKLLYALAAMATLCRIAAAVWRAPSSA